MAKKGLLKNVGGVLFNVLQVIPDTVQVAEKIVDAAVPLVDKAMDRHHAHKQSLLKLPDVRDMQAEEAKSYLENLGFQVVLLLAKPSRKWSRERPGEVVAMKPASGQHLPGSLVKLYYMTPEVLEASQQAQDLMNVLGLDLSQAQQILEQAGFHVSTLPLKGSKTLAHKAPNQVLSMEPRPNLLTKSKKGSLIKLYYLDEEGILTSQALLKQDKENKDQIKKNLEKNLEKNLKGIQKIFKPKD